MADKKEFLNGAKAIGSLKNAIKLYSEEATTEALEESRKLLEILPVITDQEEVPNESRANKSLRNAIQIHLDGRDEEAFEKCKVSLTRQLESVKKECQKPEHRQRLLEYVDCSENLNGFLKEKIEETKQKVKEVDIKDGRTGYSYKSVFGEYLNQYVKSVDVYDAYIRTKHQVKNLQTFCDLIVEKKIPVETINLITRQDMEADKIQRQNDLLLRLKNSLKDHNIELNIIYSDLLHDRQIRLSTGWVIKIGRGLDYFKRSEIPISDLDQRQCLETTVLIYHQDSVQGSASGRH